MLKPQIINIIINDNCKNKLHVVLHKNPSPGVSENCLRIQKSQFYVDIANR